MFEAILGTCFNMHGLVQFGKSGYGLSGALKGVFQFSNVSLIVPKFFASRNMRITLLPNLQNIRILH